jgi:glycerol-3-phosphate acyltransferase PlsY
MSQPWIWVLAALVFGYALGSIPFGLLLTRAAGLGDIRKVGSGNIGATNVLRVGGKGLAAATLLLDAAKGFLAVWIAARYGLEPSLAAAAGAVLGHMFPVWLGFKGGKGGATTLGAFLCLAWPVVVVGAGFYVLIAVVFRYSSLATLLATALAALAAWWLAPQQVAIMACLLVPLVWAKHHQNISRLLAGTESKIGRKAAPTAGDHGGPPRGTV